MKSVHLCNLSLSYIRRKSKMTPATRTFRVDVIIRQITISIITVSVQNVLASTGES